MKDACGPLLMLTKSFYYRYEFTLNVNGKDKEMTGNLMEAGWLRLF